MMQHTQVPWGVTEVIGRGKTKVVSYNGEIIADTWSHNNFSCEANARLIAAAPDLLEALEESADAMTTEYNKLCDATSPEYLHQYLPILKLKIDKARAAIAKARGEQS